MIKEKGIGEDYKMHPELIAIMISAQPQYPAFKLTLSSYGGYASAHEEWSGGIPCE